MRGILVALFVTLLLEVPLVALAYPHQRARMTVTAVVANTLTNLTLNAVLPHVALVRGHHVLVGEILAVAVEAIAYAAASRPPEEAERPLAVSNVGRALVVSGVANALSYGVGPAVAALLLR